MGDVIKVGGVLCEVEVDDGNASTVDSLPAVVLPPSSPSPPLPTVPAPAPESPAPTSSLHDPDKVVFATPATRRIAREEAVNLGDVAGTGKDGRVTKSDVLAFVSSRTAGSSPPVISDPALSTAVSPSGPTTSTSAPTPVPLSPVRKAMFRAMTATLQIPHFSYSDTLDVTLLERLRQVLNAHIPLRYRKTLSGAEELELARLAAWGGGGGGGGGDPGVARVPEEMRYDRLTMLPLLVKALSVAMDSHPLFTCALAPQASDPSAPAGEPTLLRRGSHDISIALSAPAGGLFTPLLRGVDGLSPYALGAQIAHLQHCAFAAVAGPPKFPKEYAGAGTLTLSNVGVVGGTTTHPIIPPTGQLAIGAMGRQRVVPTYVGEDVGTARKVAVEGVEGLELRVVPRLMMVSLLASWRL